MSISNPYASVMHTLAWWSSSGLTEPNESVVFVGGESTLKGAVRSLRDGTSYEPPKSARSLARYAPWRGFGSGSGFAALVGRVGMLYWRSTGLECVSERRFWAPKGSRGL